MDITRAQGAHYFDLCLPKQLTDRLVLCIWHEGCACHTACSSVQELLQLPCTCRLILWFLLALPAVREWYEYIEGRSPSQADSTLPTPVQPPHPSSRPLPQGSGSAAGSSRGSCKPLGPKLGSFAWVAIAATCLETMISFKFGRGLYPNRCPRSILIAWAVGLGGMAVALVVWQACLTFSAKRS